MAAALQWMTRVSTMRALTPSRAIWLLLGVSMVALWPTLAALARIWRDMFDYQHGPVIAAISVFWLARSGRIIDASAAQRMHLALPLLAVALTGWLVAYRANSELMQQVLVPVIPLLAVLAAGGPQMCRHAAAPLAYLYFAIPVWEQLLPLLQWLTTIVAETILGWIGVPVEVEGHHVTIPSGKFSIVEGCSGKRYLIIALAFAVLAAAIERLSWRKVLVVLGSATALALLTNWLRVVVVIYAGHITEMQHYLVATEHKSFGYALFLPLLAAIFWCARRLSRRPSASQAKEVAVAASPGAPQAQWLPALILTSIPVFVWARAPADWGEHFAGRLGALPVVTGTWQGPLPPSPDWHPRFVNPAEERRAAYAMNGNRVELYINVYGVQSPGRELVFHANSAWPADRWTLVKRLPRGGEGPAAVVVADSDGTRWVVAEIFEVGGRLTALAGFAQFYYGAAAVLEPVPSGVLAIAARCEDDCVAARRDVYAFWAEYGGQLAELIPDRL